VVTVLHTPHTTQPGHSSLGKCSEYGQRRKLMVSSVYRGSQGFSCELCAYVLCHFMVRKHGSSKSKIIISVTDNLNK